MPGLFCRSAGASKVQSILPSSFLIFGARVGRGMILGHGDQRINSVQRLEKQVGSDGRQPRLELACVFAG